MIVFKDVFVTVGSTLKRGVVAAVHVAVLLLLEVKSTEISRDMLLVVLLDSLYLPKVFF